MINVMNQYFGSLLPNGQNNKTQNGSSKFSMKWFFLNILEKESANAGLFETKFFR